MASTGADTNGASKRGATVPFIIGGQEIQPKATLDVTSPRSGQVVHQCGDASVSDAKQAVEAAARAFPSWSRTTPAQKRSVFLRAADIVGRRATEMKGYHMSETGADDAWAAFQIHLAAECLLDVASRIMAVEGRIPNTQDAGVGGLVLKEPYGVVLSIAPWNAPYILGLRGSVSAIAAGNTVVFKGSELSPRTHWAICSVLQEAGLPDGVLNYIVCGRPNAPEVTKALIAHPLVKKIGFTGSTAVGRIIAATAGEHLKPVLMELGGKAPAIVCADADLDHAAGRCAMGALFYAGQICMSTEKILVHEDVRAEFEGKLRSAVEKMYPADGEAPILINEAAAEKSKALLRDALGKGARLVCGDVDAAEDSKTRLRPVVLSGVTPDMDIYATESFGPSVSVIGFSSEDEAVEVANDTEYGLSAAVFSGDLRRAVRLARRIESGAVHINGMTVHDEMALPHGGVKASGFGRFNGGLDEWVRTKTVTYDM